MNHDFKNVDKENNWSEITFDIIAEMRSKIRSYDLLLVESKKELLFKFLDTTQIQSWQSGPKLKVQNEYEMMTDSTLPNFWMTALNFVSAKEISTIH